MKKKILEALKQGKDSYISGEELSDHIGVTRTAVWKHIKQLKEEGYEIESSSRKGYRLVSEPDSLDAKALQIELNTTVIGREIYHFESIDSTNNKAKLLASEGAAEGTVVIAEEQTLGRGRLGRHWVSPKSTGIWMSIILRPNIEPTDAAKITLLTAAAVALAMKKTLECQPGIKWPNDIILEKRKICGILTEMSSELNSVNYLVVGIGINANMDAETFPEDIRKVATSISSCLGKEISRRELVKSIFEEFEILYLEYTRTRSMKEIVEICKAYSVTLDNRVRIISRNQEIQAYAEDLTEDGELVIRKDNGERETIISGEVSVRGILDYV
ncbi:MAG: biotin--[acetyl-CoA-carboxylase] ligase [Bacillota bacterium]